MRGEAAGAGSGHCAAEVIAALERLPRTERRALSLAFFEGLSYREVAARLDLAENTVRAQIRRALTSLAGTLDVRAGVDHSEGANPESVDSP